MATMALLAGLLMTSGAIAAEPREITWDDLVPAEAEFNDPFTRLDEDQLFELSLVAQIRDRIEAGKEVDEKTLENYHKRVKDLKDQDVDIDGLIAMRDQVAEERVAKTYLASQELDGKPVRIPGYLLPLEYDGKKVSEFLLVPYVGACIHTPPPPPNQMVYVALDEAHVLRSLYEPVWVTGTLSTNASSRRLSFVDGSADVATGYALKGLLIEPYE